jgi:hypothetical protein
MNRYNIEHATVAALGFLIGAVFADESNQMVSEGGPSG